MDFLILFEDQNLVVINKSAGLTVNRSETTEYTLQDWVESKYPSNIRIERSGIVHRLDKETSGCLIIAKTPESFAKLQRQFKNREVKKEYLALVHGQVESQEGTIKVPLGRSRADRQKFAVTPGGRISETSYQVVSYWTLDSGLPALPAGRLTLLRLFPKTGRTHQIRVHLQYFGHPIVADDKYAGEKRAKEDRAWCQRLFLHAAKITFTHPVTNKIVSIEAELPEELKVVLSKLSAHAKN